ncbi:MAG: bifunctional UDP-N-acetylglucosamine diphosphorylase/glucosamine-1-phosphate N-acetyltransferase GlmU [Planctomycetota bacterium]|jgi:bifunctional UDP-N-acetylglucosamine pyrophosphorylase/glucosamine-1-phosphate N-acetyltransferase
MSNRPLAAVILAAGQGKRMAASVPKVLVETCGRSMVEHVLDAAAPLDAHPTVVVYGHGGDAVRAALSGRDLSFAHQPEQNGTGHAVQCALPALGDFEGDLLVLCGDTPLLTTRVLTELVRNHRAHKRALTVLSADLEKPGSLGRMVRGADGELTAIREAADATPEELAIREINTGVMIIESGILRGALDRLQPDNAQGELYLTDVPALLLGDGRVVGAFKTDDAHSAQGVNRPSELLMVTEVLRRRILEEHAARGVRFEDPSTTVVDAGVEIGAGTVIRPFCHLATGTRVGPGCRLGPHSAAGPGTSLGAGVVIGSQVELRGVTVEAKARVPGPARLVGAVIGPGAWIGPGVVTQGSSEGRIVIGDAARIEAGAVLVAPLTVGSEARVAAGAVVVRDVGTPAITADGDDNDA